VTARVTYLFRCQVPLASLLMCSAGWSMMMGDAWFDPVAIQSIARMAGNPPKRPEDLPAWTAQWKQQKALHDLQQRRVDAYKGHEADFAEVEWPFMLDVLLALPGARYMVLTGEAQLPLQAARYYPRVDQDDMNKMWDAQEQNASSGGGGSGNSVEDALQPVASAVDSAANAIDQGVDAVNGAKNQVNSAQNQLQQGKQALSDLKKAAKNAGNLSNLGKQAASSAAKDVTDAASNVENALKNAGKNLSKPGAPGGMNLDDF
jgi:hypothetical protein